MLVLLALVVDLALNGFAWTCLAHHGNRQASHFATKTQLYSLSTHHQEIEKDVGFQVAPMQCYTNLALRELLQNMSPSTTLWTEMEKVGDLLQADAKGLERRLGPATHKNLVLQLGGNDPVLLQDCLGHLSGHGYSFEEVNLNCGCPSIEAGGASCYGASLMKDKDLTAELVQSLVDVVPLETTAISLKCRIGVYESFEEWEASPHSSKDHLQFLHDYVGPSCEAGLSKLIVHARPAVLAGLSPTKNRQVPKLDYGVVEGIAADLDIPVTLNGGIQGLGDYRVARERAQSTSVTDLMAGRWVLRRPLDLSVVEQTMRPNGSNSEEESFHLGKENLHKESILVAKEAVEDYSNYALQCLEESRGKDPRLPTLPDLILPLFLVSEQLREDYEALDKEDNVDDGTPAPWLPAGDMEDIYDCVCETLTSMEDILGKKTTKFSPTAIQFNKVASSIKSLTGTKVANKWKRNRAEL